MVHDNLERKCVVCVDNIYAWNVLCVFVLTNIFCMPHHVPSICFAFDDPPDQHYIYFFRFKSDILQRAVVPCYQVTPYVVENLVDFVS